MDPPGTHSRLQELAFGVSRPALQVQPGTDRILGYGLEATAVTVRTEWVEIVPAEAISLGSVIGDLDHNDVRINDQTRIARHTNLAQWQDAGRTVQEGRS